MNLFIECGVFFRFLRDCRGLIVGKALISRCTSPSSEHPAAARAPAGPPATGRLAIDRFGGSIATIRGTNITNLWGHFQMGDRRKVSSISINDLSCFCPVSVRFLSCFVLS